MYLCSIDCKNKQLSGKRIYPISLRQMAALVLFAFLTIAQNNAAAQQVKISEILFNPPTGGSDYVELYNDSDTPISMGSLRLAQWRGDSISKLHTLDTGYVIGAHDYCVITTDAQFVKDSYDVRYPNKIVQVKSLPTYANASGTVIVCKADSTIVDRLDYSESMHSRLLKDVEGVALERRSYGASTQDAANWFSAASTAGYGTPTYANSQSREFLFTENNFVVEPEVFSPDNDGYNDLLNITYELLDETVSANINVTDKNGRVVRHLIRGGVLGTHGIVVWDGSDDSGQQCRQGRYVLIIEAYNTDGKRQTIRRTVTLVSIL